MSDERYVLVVDDDEDIRTVTAVVLESEGYRVRVAGSGHEALATIEREGTPAALLVDLMMPEMDGGELIERLQRTARGKDVPVAIISGDIAVRERARRLGASSLVKPVDLDELLALVAEMTARSSNATMEPCPSPAGSRS